MGNCISRRSKVHKQLAAAEKRYDGALAAFASQENQLLMLRERLRVNELDIHSFTSQAHALHGRIQHLDAENCALVQANSHLGTELDHRTLEAQDYQNMADAIMLERDNILIRLQDLREHTKTLAADYGKRMREIKNTMECEHESTRTLLQRFQDCIRDQDAQLRLKDGELTAQQQSIELLTQEREEAQASAEEYKLMLKSYEDISARETYDVEDAKANCEHLMGSMHPLRRRNRATTGFLDTSLLGRPRKDSGVAMDDPYHGDIEEWSPVSEGVC